jgi:hypothetical protein
MMIRSPSAAGVICTRPALFSRRMPSLKSAPASISVWLSARMSRARLRQLYSRRTPASGRRT